TGAVSIPPPPWTAAASACGACARARRRPAPRSKWRARPARAPPCGSRCGGRMIRVLICDDQRVVADGLRAILSAAPGMEVVGTVHDGAEAVERAGERGADGGLMDLKMPVLNGVQATREIRARYPATRVLVLTTYDADEWLFDAIR